MILRKSLISVFVFLLFCGYGFAQSAYRFKLYKNQHDHFSFEIPIEWKIVDSGNGDDYNCIPLKKADKETYKDYNGIVFNLRVIRTALAPAIESEFHQDNMGNYFFNAPLEGITKAEKIKRKVFTGVKRISPCRVSSKEANGQVDSTLVDGCETIYLSNGRITLCFTTDGIALDDEVYDKLIKTLRFF
ncbi:hypothetical protein ACVWYN_002232 [Pedobacter sp. UYP24]